MCCDSSRTKDQWHPYAAASAAPFALLLKQAYAAAALAAPFALLLKQAYAAAWGPATSKFF